MSNMEKAGRCPECGTKIMVVISTGLIRRHSYVTKREWCPTGGQTLARAQEIAKENDLDFNAMIQREIL